MKEYKAKLELRFLAHGHADAERAIQGYLASGGNIGALSFTRKPELSLPGGIIEEVCEGKKCDTDQYDKSKSDPYDQAHGLDQ